MSVPAPDLPTRSQDGLAALDIFYDDFNDFNFYVEDAEQENLYGEILQKLFKNVKITRIFPLGGKSAVIQHATSEANSNIRAFRAYILDRDFDHLLGTQLVHPNVFYLDRFCIESYLLEPPAIIELVIENHPKKKRDNVKLKLSLDAQIRSFYSRMRPLFMLFFCAQSLDLGITNCSSPPELFCMPKRPWELSQAAINSYRVKLLAAAETNGLNPIQFDSKCDLASSQTSEVSDHQLVSGKFIAAMLFHYVKSHYSLGSMTFESYVYRLAKNCTLRPMRAFASRVRKAERFHRAGSSGAMATELDA